MLNVQPTWSLGVRNDGRTVEDIIDRDVKYSSFWNLNVCWMSNFLSSRPSQVESKSTNLAILSQITGEAVPGVVVARVIKTWLVYQVNSVGAQSGQEVSHSNTFRK